MEVKYQIGDQIFVVNIEGEVITGADRILLLEDKNLLAGTPWNEKGFTIQPFLEDEQFRKIKQGITNKIRDLIRRVGGEVDVNFGLEQYHRYVNDEQHLQIAQLINYGWNVAEFPIDFSIIEERVSEMLGVRVSAEAKHVNAADFDTGLSTLKYDKVYVFSLRIVRPGKILDNNPPHRDVWIDSLRNAVNIYAPLCGSTENSSLPLIPGSHFFIESEVERTVSGALVNGVKYSVPCVTGVKRNLPILQRPNPSENEVMIFSPYLVHGGALNLEVDTTRISIEVRFWGLNE